jgi:putative ABC transport system permease protein
MLRIALSTLSSRKGGMIGALAAVGLAVVLVVSCGILLQSSLQAPIPVERLQAASVVVQKATTISGSNGEANFSVSLSERPRLRASEADRIRRLPGVAAVVADRTVFAAAVDRHARILKGENGSASVGHGWESAALTPYLLQSGHAPTRAGDVVVDAHLATTGGLHVGDRLRILTIGGPATFRVAGIARTPPSQRLPEQAAVFFRSDQAARLSGAADRVDLLGIITRPGADKDHVVDTVRDQFRDSHVQVLTGAKRGDAESPDDALSREDIVAGLTVFAVLAAFVAIFVVASTFALSVQQRHRELALFRAIGATPRQVRQLVAGEALVISVVAVLLALPLSVVAAFLEKGLFVRAGMIPSGLHVVISWLPLMAGLVAAIATTQVAAFVSARRASKIRPTDALREATVQHRPVSWLRAVAGLAALAGGTAVVLLAAHSSGGLRQSDAPAAAMLLMVAAALLGPLLAWPFAWLVGSPLAAFAGAPGLLAWANTRANLRRAASVATPLMLAISVVSTMYIAKTILHKETHTQTAKRTTATYVLRARKTSGLSRDIAAATRRLPGVANASGTIATSVLVAADGTNLNAFPARGVDVGTLERVLSLDIVSGSLANVRGDGVAVSTQSAADWGWHTGDRVHLWLGDGTPATVRVVAQYTRPLGFGEVVLPRQFVADHVTQPLDDAVFVTGEHGVSSTDLARILQRLRVPDPTVQIVSRSAYEADIDAAAEKQSLALYVLLGLIVLFCALALVNALTMAIGERAREFALLRLIGATKRQVRAMIRTETAIMVGFGLTMGSLIAAPGLALLNRSLTGSLLPSVPLKIYVALLGFYATVGLAATVFPLRLSLRADPVTATASRD